MIGAIAHDEAQHLRTVLTDVLSASPGLSAAAREAFGRLIDVLESNADAVVFPAGARVTTQQAGALLGVSRMTVVRLIDHGELNTESGAVHRRISVSELARYQANSGRRRRAGMAELADDINEDTAADQVIKTR